MIENVETLDDPRLDAFARLTEAQLRSKLEPEKALFIAEVGKVIERALAAGMEPSVAAHGSEMAARDAADHRRDLRALGRRRPPRVRRTARRVDEAHRVRADARALERSAARSCPAWPISYAERGASRCWKTSRTTHERRRHLPLGRSPRHRRVLVTPACYDPLYRRAVRMSMGTVFQVPWTRIGEEAGAGATGTGGWAPAGVPLLHELGFKTAAFALTDDSGAAGRSRSQRRGAPGAGVRHRGRRPRARHHRPLRLHRAHPHGLRVDSLNVAAASCIGLLAAAPVG